MPTLDTALNAQSTILKLTALASLVFLASCSEQDQSMSDTQPTTEEAAIETIPEAAPSPTRFGGQSLKMPADIISPNPAASAERTALYGDLHVHTAYSFDAFAFGTLATPYDAYRYAKGGSITHPAGFEMKLRKPLDFYAVTDHAMFLGAMSAAADTSTEFSKLDHVQNLHNMNAPEKLNTDTIPERIAAFSSFLGQTLSGVASGEIDAEMVNGITRNAWLDIINAAEEHYEPGEFTTFVGYEYTTSSDDRGNLHRNVIFQSADKLPAMPFSRFHSQNPEGLWHWLDGLRGQGIEAMSIPHNSNGSNGQMFKLTDWAGDPMDDEYANLRMRNEPVIELTQIKGTSETHPVLSANDEWADFEIMPYRVATNLPSEPKGSYAREALLNGLAFQDKGTANPYKFGFVAASDTHNATTSDDESDYFSKAGLLDANAVLRGAVPLPEESAKMLRETGGDLVQIEEVDGNDYASGGFDTWGASGLTGVWADENSREAIYSAFRRKETFATSGPRMRIRLFGGYDFDEAMLDDHNMIRKAYSEGVPMGGDLLSNKSKVPTFLALASRDADSASLQRLQIIKGWTIDGEHHEKVFDVACSDNGTVDPTTHRCPDNGAKVNLEDCSISASVGDPELSTVWTDPEFSPEHNAFYYARVLENPTCRWSTWDAVNADVPHRADLKPTIQERAWSSPIWFIPQ